jgi:hypothetical protein
MVFILEIEAREHHQECFHPLLPRLLLLVSKHPTQLLVSKHPTHRENFCRMSSSQLVPDLPLPTSDYSHHDFLRFCHFHENLYVGMSHATDKKTKLHATPS